MEKQHCRAWAQGGNEGERARERRSERERESGRSRVREREWMGEREMCRRGREKESREREREREWTGERERDGVQWVQVVGRKRGKSVREERQRE